MLEIQKIPGTSLDTIQEKIRAVTSHVEELKLKRKHLKREHENRSFLGKMKWRSTYNGAMLEMCHAIRAARFEMLSLLHLVAGDAPSADALGDAARMFDL
jgi:hypothetical protein